VEVRNVAVCGCLDAEFELFCDVCPGFGFWAAATEVNSATIPHLRMNGAARQTENDLFIAFIGANE